MKKAIVFLAVMVLVPALGWSAVTCNPGNYSGKLWSVVSDLNGKSGTLAVTKEGDKCLMKFTTEGSTELWEVSGMSLIQKEFDATGKVTDQYGATLQGDKYVINCKDRAKNKCDAGVDSRNYWQLKTTPNEVTYTVYGVSKDQKANPTASAAKRHEFSFKLGAPGK